MKKNKTIWPGCPCGKPFSIVHLENPLGSQFYKILILDYQKWLETSISYWEYQIKVRVENSRQVVRIEYESLLTTEECTKELNKLINEQNLMIENGL